MSAEAAIGLSEVGVCHGRDRWAVRHVSAVLPAGGVVALVGTNGAGKTSLLRALVGLHPPEEGEVSLFGRRLRPDDAGQLAEIAYVGQRKPLYGTFRVRDVLRLCRTTNPAWDEDFAVARLREVGVNLGQRVDRLSGGQRTQLALTLALAKRARLLVLDEPMGDLDPVARHQVFAFLMSDVAERGATVVLSSHIVSELELTCDQLLLLREGRLILSGPVEEIVAEHVVLTGPTAGLATLIDQVDVIDADHDGDSARVLARTWMDRRFLTQRWQLHQVDMQAVVMGHLQARRPELRGPAALRSLP